MSNGLTVSEDGPAELDIGIDGGLIAALAGRGQLSGYAERVIDATGKLVVPGGIDPHVHCAWPVGDPAGSLTAGPDVVSKAALFGGTTTLIDFAHRKAEERLSQTLERQDRTWHGNSCCDYAFHIMLTGGITEQVLAELPEAIEAGFPSIKVFTTDIKPGHPLGALKADVGSMLGLLGVAAANNGIVAVHAEDNELVMHMYDKLRKLGQTSYRNMPLVHSSLSEDLAFRRVISLANSVDGAAVYLVHVSAALGVDAIAEARSRRSPIYGETLHQYALRTQDDYSQPDGMKYHNYPSLKSQADVDALWRGMMSGDIATVATDELCTSYAVKTVGSRIDDVTGGNVGVEPRMALIYTELVGRRKLGLKRFVDVTSTNAAKIFGLYPRKGAIRVGSDADLVVLDPNVSRTITARMLHESDYTPWEGWHTDAWPSLTLLRGKTVVDQQVFLGSVTDGQLVRRKLQGAVLDGKAVS